MRGEPPVRPHSTVVVDNHRLGRQSDKEKKRGKTKRKRKTAFPFHLLKIVKNLEKKKTRNSSLKQQLKLRKIRAFLPK